MCLPSGLILAPALSGLPNSSVRWMSGVLATALAAAPSPAGWAELGPTAVIASTAAATAIQGEACAVAEGMAFSCGRGAYPLASLKAPPAPRARKAAHLQNALHRYPPETPLQRIRTGLPACRTGSLRAAHPLLQFAAQHLAEG